MPQNKKNRYLIFSYIMFINDKIKDVEINYLWKIDKKFIQFNYNIHRLYKTSTWAVGLQYSYSRMFKKNEIIRE